MKYYLVCLLHFRGCQQKEISTTIRAAGEPFFSNLPEQHFLKLTSQPDMIDTEY